MKRDLHALTEKQHDLLVIGGGIYGACTAWDAVLRGLSVGLIDRGDFGGATSANSLKIIHGGFRYLQQGDFKRMRESIRERRTLMKIAPHLVHPLPVVIPTDKHLMKGKAVFSLALLINALISFDRNRINDPQKHTSAGRIMSKNELSKALPDICRKDFTGGAMFFDAQVYNPERLTLAFIRSAEQAGASVANYIKATGFLKKNNTILGVEAEDVLTGEHFDIRAKMVVNTSGPWMNSVEKLLRDVKKEHKIQLAKAVNLVTRSISGSYAVGISGKKGPAREGADDSGNRYFFLVPWRKFTIIGTSYAPYEGSPDKLTVTEEDIGNLLDQVNTACPSLHLKMDDVCFSHAGLLPCSSGVQTKGDMPLATHYSIHDYRKDGIKGLISVVGVKYTTARHVAECVVERVFAQLGRKSVKSLSSSTELFGGCIEYFASFLQSQIEKRPSGLDEEDVRSLVYNYGSNYPEVLNYLQSMDAGGKSAGKSIALLKAEVCHSIHKEMAQKLTDVVLRRTELGTAGHPGDEALNICAEAMKREMGWSPARTEEELKEVKALFNRCM